MCRAAKLVFTMLLMICAGTTPAADKFSIHLVVRGAEPNVGNILISLFASADSYLQEPIVEERIKVDANGFATLSIGDRESGEYAIAVVYDKNENGKLDTGLFRIPKEKVGFSNNAQGRFGPAKWKDTRFLLEESDVEIEIQLKKAKKDQ